MEPPEQLAVAPQLAADVDVSHCFGGTSTNQVGSQRNVSSQDQEEPKLETDSGRLAFQDSNLSPALFLLPVNSRPENITEYSLIQQSDTEFVPLRAYPDVSMVSELLSQHPLTQTSILSEESAVSCVSLSQHSLLPADQSRPDEEVHTDARTAATFPDVASEVAKDETFFLRKEVSAQDLLDLLQKDVGLQSSTSSAVSSASVKSTTSGSKSGKSMGKREGPSGEVSLTRQSVQQADRGSNPAQSRSSDVCNITMGSRSPRPDDSSEALRRELLSEIARRDSGSKTQAPTPSFQSTTTKVKEVSEDGSAMLTNTGGAPFSAGVERIPPEQDLWSSGNQTGIDGSYLNFLPQSQSTPGVFKLPPKSTIKPKLSAIESSKENSCETSVSQRPAEDQDASSAEVQTLPSLTYIQKVDAWRANQTSGKTSLFDSLALQGFSGVSPKKKAYDAVSERLSRILSQQARSLQQQRAPRSLSAIPCGSSSPRREAAAGSVPGRNANEASAAPPSVSPLGRSQSHSSFSTVVTSVNKEEPPGEENRHSDDDEPSLSPLPPLGSTVQPSPLVTLGHFSDVSLDRDPTLSSSQESYGSVKKQTSFGTSSIVSLEIDNYAPYWTSKLSTPPPLPRFRELNIDERIPLYLHNLGIDQSPSAILTTFAPRGPIREPQLSPTDLTLKGSTGTAARSARTSQGGNPHKGEFSRCSVLSVDSSTSVTFSLDSLGPAAPERLRRPSPTLIPYDLQDEHLSLGQPDNQLGDEPKCGETNLDPQTSAKAAEGSLLSSKSLLENVTLTSSSASSSAPPTARQLLPHEASSASLNNRLQDSSFSSSFTAGEPRSASSPPWTRSSSESTLKSETHRQLSVGQENTASSCQPDSPLTQSAAPFQTSQDNDGAATSLILSKSARRTEPEGCSAAPPANAPNQPTLVKPPANVSAQQLTSSPADSEEEEPPAGSFINTGSSVAQDDDKGESSDHSSQSSLALQVASLLQNDSPATVASSTPSHTDHDESKTREWMTMKTSGQQSQSDPQLDIEDRKRIEEIKRELSLKKTIKSRGGTDTESSSGSSFKVPQRHDGLQPAAFSDARDTPDDPQGVDGVTRSIDSITADLEAKVCEIAAREGVTLPSRTPRPITSITIATCRRSTSPSPPSSPAPSLSPAPQPLLSTEPPPPQDGPTLPEANGKMVPERLDTPGGQHQDLPPSPQAGTAQPAQSPARTDHVSRLHLTLSPKPPADPLTPADPSSRPSAASPTDFVSLRRSSPAVSSPDEGVGLSSPPEWADSRDTARRRAPDRTDAADRGTTADTSARFFTVRHRTEIKAPALLPYKPHGSEELFYVPQTEADVSSAERSDTTMESSHTGSDDAVPPRFSSDVLGEPDPGLDRGVTFRHTEGIYSKRLKSSRMQEARRTASEKRERESGKKLDAGSSGPSESSRRDQGTSPVHFLTPDASEPTGSVQPCGSQKEAELPRQNSLDQLWQKFCLQWNVQESHPSRGREATLLQRLERLSRLIQRQNSGYVRVQTKREEEESERGEEETSRPFADDTSFFSSSSCHSRLVQTDDASTTSSSPSTVDTARLVRVFGAHRVQRLQSDRSLSKLYGAINRQKEERGERRETAADSSSSSWSSSLSGPSHCGPSRSLTAKKLVNRGVQAGHLEIVRNATRRHTRDVGTTFPSPRASGITTARKNRRSPRKTYPAGVSWFVSADGPSSAARKENRPDRAENNVAWFEAYGAVRPWRQPLRQRFVQEEKSVAPDERVHPGDPRGKTTGVSLQEALQLHRPDFIFRSRQRVQRLALQTEDRKLHAICAGDNFYQQRAPRHQGTVPLRRAVPRKEMIQRSKLIYDNLPEIQRRREEERRKVEYRTYRLNAQLYNKRITNQVLGRRSAWH